MRLRLVNQEDAVHAFWQQYRDKGNELLQQWEGNRQDEIRDIAQKLEKQRGQLLNEYKEARTSLSSISRSLQRSPIDLLEKDWHQKQTEIHKSLDESMRTWKL